MLKVLSTILLMFTLAISCDNRNKPSPPVIVSPPEIIYDTIILPPKIIKDTVYLEKVIKDTVLIETIIRDTTYVEKIVYDTIVNNIIVEYPPIIIHDTIKEIVYDTIQLPPQIIKDTIYITETIRDTVQIPPVTIRDTIVQIIRDTITIKETMFSGGESIFIGNQWMGEPIRESKVTGAVISDTYGSSDRVGGGPETAFDGDLNTFRRAYVQQGAWVGLDFGKQETIVKVRIYPNTQYNSNTMTLNGCLIQYSNNRTNWTTVHTISGAELNRWYEIPLEGITARYFRVYASPTFSYGGHIAELEFIKQN